MDPFKKFFFNEDEQSEASEASLSASEASDHDDCFTCSEEDEQSEASEASLSASDHDDCFTCSEEETRSVNETPTTSDDEFIVSDSEMAEAERSDEIEDSIELLFESFVNLQEEHKILKKELQKQSGLLWEIHREMNESEVKQNGSSEAKRKRC